MDANAAKRTTRQEPVELEITHRLPVARNDRGLHTITYLRDGLRLEGAADPSGSLPTNTLRLPHERR